MRRGAAAAIALLLAVAAVASGRSGEARATSPHRAAAITAPARSPASSLSPTWDLSATDAAFVPQSVLQAASSITVAVVDTGADVTAPDLAPRSPATWNTRDGTSGVDDVNGHGTFVSSLVAETSGGAHLLIIKAGSDGGSFTDFDESAAITYAIDHGARIINLSIGGPTTSPTERRAIAYAVDHGALVIAAVGNEYASKDPVEYPAALLQPVGSNGIGGVGLAVTASTVGGQRASFANTGSWVSLAAPGDHVFGDLSSLSSPLIYPRASLAGFTGLHGYASGTSFAAPQVAGAAALVWAANPSLTAQQVAEILKETASGGGRWTPDLGFGVIDVAAAVARAQQGPPTGVLLSGLREGDRVHLTWAGDAASSYTLSLQTDGRAGRTVLPATSVTSTSLALAKGHTYSFTVSTLDGSGAVGATSAPLTFVVPR